MRNTKTVEYRDEELAVRLTITAPTIESGTARTVLRVDGQAALESEPAATTTRRILRLVTYPDLMAATVAVEGLPWPLDFETFIALPEELGALWEQAVYDLNPRWLQRADDGGKKTSAMSSTGG